MGSPSLEVFNAFIDMTQNNLLWTCFKQGLDQRPLEVPSNLHKLLILSFHEVPRFGEILFFSFKEKSVRLVNRWNQCEGHVEIFYNMGPGGPFVMISGI